MRHIMPAQIIRGTQWLVQKLAQTEPLKCHRPLLRILRPRLMLFNCYCYCSILPPEDSLSEKPTQYKWSLETQKEKFGPRDCLLALASTHAWSQFPSDCSITLANQLSLRVSPFESGNHLEYKTKRIVAIPPLSSPYDSVIPAPLPVSEYCAFPHVISSVWNCLSSLLCLLRSISYFKVKQSSRLEKEAEDQITQGF